MSRIRSKNTKIEVILAQALASEGFKFRRNLKSLPGRPDIAFPSEKIAVFCDSSFWHGRDWPSLRRRLRTNSEFWIQKIKKNRARDRKVNRELGVLGWKVLRFWEEDIKGRVAWCVRTIVRATANRRRLASR